jgi:hypothetical protein
MTGAQWDMGRTFDRALEDDQKPIRKPVDISIPEKQTQKRKCGSDCFTDSGVCGKLGSCKETKKYVVRGGDDGL